MKTRSTEISYYLCEDHYDFPLTNKHPDHIFNWYIVFPSKSCGVTDCCKATNYRFTGISIPSSFSEEDLKIKGYKVINEVFLEAKAIFEAELNIREGLITYLKTRLVSATSRQFLAEKVCRHHADSILQKLKFHPDSTFTDIAIHRIIKELDLYPEGTQ